MTLMGYNHASYWTFLGARLPEGSIPSPNIYKLWTNNCPNRFGTYTFQNVIELCPQTYGIRFLSYTQFRTPNGEICLICFTLENILPYCLVLMFLCYLTVLMI